MKIIAQEKASSKTVKIEVLENDELNISQIGEVIKLIPLQHATSNLYLSTNRVIVDIKEDCLFISYGNFPISDYQYKLSTGEHVRILMKEKNIVFDYPIHHFSYPGQKALGIVCRDEIYKFDFNGNLINRLKANRDGDVFFFNNYYWGCNIEFTGKGFDKFTLFSTENFELNDSNYEFIHMRGDCEPPFVKVSKDPFFNSVGRRLYFSHQSDPVIYSLSNGRIDTICKFIFNANDFTCPDFFSRRHILLGDKWTILTYNYKEFISSFVYSLQNNESYNLKNGMINDDLFGTKGISAREIRIVNEDYFCFILPTLEVKNRLNENCVDSQLCLVLMKVR
jgi:hypothetical protein